MVLEKAAKKEFWMQRLVAESKVYQGGVQLHCESHSAFVSG